MKQELMIGNSLKIDVDVILKLLKTNGKEYNKGGYEGQDYGLFHGKKCLYVKGAEKLVNTYNLKKMYKVNQQTSDGKFATIVECYLYDENNNLISMGIGGGLADVPTKNTTRASLDWDYNKSVIMAKHRALKCAVRDAFNVVDIFTQDLEDLYLDEQKDYEALKHKKRSDEAYDIVQYCLLNKDYFISIINNIKVAYGENSNEFKLVTKLAQQRNNENAKSILLMLLGMQEKEMHALYMLIPLADRKLMNEQREKQEKK